MMSKLKWLLPVVILVFGLSACKSTESGTATKSSSKQATVITSKNYTTAELEKRYVKIADVVMKPLEQASYKESQATIKKTATAGQTTLAEVKLELQDNNSNQALTQALLKYLTAAQKMLTTMLGTNQAAYTAASKEFSLQSSTIAKTYFNGQLPASMVNYSKRMSGQTSSSSSAKASSSAKSSASSK